MKDRHALINFSVCIFVFCFCFSGVSWAASNSEAALLKVGFAEWDITPAIGMEQPGGYGKAYLKKLHDPCKVRAALFDDGGKKVVVVGVDALMVPGQLVKEVRKEIEQRCGIPPEAVLIGASHSHSSGPLGMVQPGQYDFADPFVQDLAYQKSSCADADYLNEVRGAIVSAVCEADSNRIASLCGVGKGIEDTVAFNRRFNMKNGLVYTHPGSGNPDIVNPAGPIDPEVGVIGVWDNEDKLIGCIVNYACHATTSPNGISANWIYYMERIIRGSFGDDVVVVFLQGFSGDITQVDNLSPYVRPSGDEYAKLVGGRVGAEAVKALLGMQKSATAKVAVKSKKIKMGHRIPDPERVKKCRELAKQDPKDVGSTEWTFAKEIVMLDALLSQSKTTDVEVQAMQIGPAVFLSAPGEMFCQFGLDLKKKSQFAFTFPVELANHCVGYVPTLDALGEHGGGYETRLSSYSNLEISAGVTMVDNLLDLASDMKPDEMPTPKKAGEFRAPWSYGNVPAEVK